MIFEDGIKLNKNSFWGKFYKWFYVSNTLPKSLCPYFWQMIIAFLFAFPVVVVRLPEELYWKLKTRQYHKKLKNNEEVYMIDYIRHEDSFISRFCIGLFSWIVILCICTYFASLVILILDGLSNPFSGVFITATAIIVLAILVMFSIKSSTKIQKVIQNTVIVGLTKEYIKGVKEKYCPTINWY